ncbi:MAG: DUF1273 family protein [Oscillospiraceae bacterium]|nr:DUF1273 family protein [Oscillospiraceae bacterium]
MKSVCFTGHRNLYISLELRQKLYTTIEELINAGVCDFYAGGAIGWDMLCEEAVIELRKKYNGIKLHLLLPCSAEEQTLKWNTYQKENYNKIYNDADSVEVMYSHYNSECMKKRNQELVNRADCCICYCKSMRSGTGQTVQMAMNKPIKIINLA